MKNWKCYFTLCLIVFVLFGFIDCGGDEQPKNQNTTINLFGNTRTATVKGHMKDSEWTGVANKIAGRINTAFNTEDEEIKLIYKEIFGRGVTYIVEVSPNGYTNIKTIGDGKTVYIALSVVDTGYVIDGMASIYVNGSTIQ